MNDYQSFTQESIEEAIKGYFYKPMERRITIYTGVEGYDLFEEEIERQAGFRRVYIGLKVPRILKVMKFKIKKSPRGRYYKLVKINLANSK